MTARFALVLAAIVLGGCAGLPPGAEFPKVASVALAHPEETRYGRQFARAARAHGGYSGFRLITVGVEGFLARVQMIDAAERTLDLQYYIFRGDETGRLLTAALLRAADRGVRVRLLIDDADTVTGDEQIMALDGHRAIEIRVFNPFAYRGHGDLQRTVEFLFNASRLDYRMHNKLLVVDNALALVGGRNIGNEYFQMDPEAQLADDDVFAAGPIAKQLSTTFDEYWNSGFAIPAEALGRNTQADTALANHRERERPGQQLKTLQTDGIDYVKRIATGEPYAGMISGRLPLVWAHARVISDSPDKKHVESGALAGRLMTESVGHTAHAVQSELLMVTPFFIPADEELQLLKDLRERNVRVRILTNSLESTPELSAQSGYLHYRVPLLEEGVELYEIRSLLGNARGSGQTALLSRYGNYALHAKLFVFDRQKLFIGSMNFDQRSKRLNTEVGLIIDSPELAQQTALRFDAMVQLENSYALALRSSGPGVAPQLVWKTKENGSPVEYTVEPARSDWQRLKLKLLSLLPIAAEL
ncbi:MAG: phospholipase D family protein [Gammaproteobacteria bacterium]|nr:phospholipase D family protein [Gammaproteobacteria bacterium]